jgi:hypothetical protein
MNGYRLTVGLIIAFLCLVCFLQSSNLGCSKNDGADDASEATDESSDNEATVFRSSGESHGVQDWVPVSEFVLGQINDQYLDIGIVVETIEESNEAVDAVKCFLVQRDGISEVKQLMDGLLVLYDNFPNLDTYFVQIDGNADLSVSTNWDHLEASINQGYTFETSAEVAEDYMMSLNDGTEDGDSDGLNDEPDTVNRMGGVESKLSPKQE